MGETRKNVRRTRWFGVVGLVTLVAIGVDQFVVTVDMARLTERCRMLSRQREFCCAMVEGGRQPGVGRMARLAPVVENSNHMIRIRWLLIIGLVARETVRILQRVVVVNVTQLALSYQVLTSQREAGGVMVEGGRFPRCCTVTLSTELRITHGLVIRIDGV